MSVSNNTAVEWRPDAREVAERLRPVTERVERIRLMALQKQAKARAWGLATAGAGLLAALLVLAAAEQGTMPALIVAGLAVMAGVGAYIAIHGNAIKAYRDIYKREVFGAAARAIAPGVGYLPNSMVPTDSFKRGGLFKSRIDRYNGEDCFSGKAGATDLIFSEIHVEREDRSTDSKGNRSSTWVTVFKGIYLIADFHKDFRCEVRVEPDVAEATFGWAGRKLQGLSGNLVRLENPDFERAFKVTSNDSVGAHYILTPDMQERLLALRNQWSKDIRLAFLDSTLHLAIPIRENWFEPRIDLPAGQSEPIGDFLIQMLTILYITETLDLNTRIWTKQ
jgi:hypothetical protein